MIKDMPILVFLGCYLDAFVQLSLTLILLKKHTFYKKFRFIISTLLYGLYMTFSYMITDNFLRIVMLFGIVIVCIEYILNFQKNTFSKTFILTFFVWLFMVLLDIFYTIFINVIFRIDIEYVRNNSYLSCFFNGIVFMTLVLIMKNKKVRRILYKIGSANLTKSENNYIKVILSLSVILISIVFYLCHINFSMIGLLVVIFIMVIIYTAIVIITIKEVTNKNKIQSEYDILLTNLSEYENLLDRQRVSNHENKNQLLVIRGMILKNENTIQYIDSIIDNQYKDSDEIIAKTNRIPSGGLKGLIYYKMLTMKDKKINVGLEVNSNINKINFSNIQTKTNQELCKIVGVYLDNAIQEVDDLKEKNINIVFEYINNELIIRISNNYKNININNIGKNGYTTKGNGHGYGLKLVNGILSSNKNFEHETHVNGKIFSQIIKLKMTD